MREGHTRGNLETCKKRRKTKWPLQSVTERKRRNKREEEEETAYLVERFIPSHFFRRERRKEASSLFPSVWLAPLLPLFSPLFKALLYLHYIK